MFEEFVTFKRKPNYNKLGEQTYKFLKTAADEAKVKYNSKRDKVKELKEVSDARLTKAKDALVKNMSALKKYEKLKTALLSEY